LVRGGTEQNELTNAADLSVTSLRQAINDFKDTRDDGNLRINLKPKMLLVPKELIWDAHELLKSAGLPGTANNNTNSFSLVGLNAMEWEYLTDGDAWFLVADSSQHEMYFFERQAPELTSDKDFDTDSMKVKLTTRFSSGWSDWRGIYGSPGV